MRSFYTHRRRQILVFSLAAFLVGGQAFALITSEEHWPFSPYPMYAELNATRTYKVIRLVGLTAAPENRELTLDSAWMRKSLAKAARHPQAPVMLRKAAGSYVQKYGWKNPLNPDGPKMQSLRVYEQVWTLQADASNRRDPDQVLLLLEYKNDGGKPTTASSAQPDDDSDTPDMTEEAPEPAP